MATGLDRTKKLFDVKFEAVGRSVGKLRNEVEVHVTAPFQSVNMMATDEGEFQGGEGSAPTPLEYFAVGLVGCLMTQIRVFSKRMKIPIRDVSITARLQWAGMETNTKVHTGQPYTAAPVGFDIDIDFDSESSEVELARLVNAAQTGCFVEQTLAQANKVVHRFRRTGGEWH